MGRPPPARLERGLKAGTGADRRVGGRDASMASKNPMPINAAGAALLALLAGCDSGGGPVLAQPTAPGPSLFVVGDSLSDIGNAAGVADYLLGQPMYPEPSIGLCHPAERMLLDRDCADILYRRSRVSDGPVA